MSAGDRGSGLQQGHQAASAVEGVQVVAATDVGFADEDLRHAGATGDLGHAGAHIGLAVNHDLFVVGDAPGLQQGLGAGAVGAEIAGVNGDFGHVGGSSSVKEAGNDQAFSTGRPAARQAA